MPAPRLRTAPRAEVAADPAVLKAYLGAEKSIERARKTARAPGETVLSVTKLGAGYGAVKVLRDVGLSVEHGGFVAVLGANGAGKSTLMRALSGLSRPVERRNPPRSASVSNRCPPTRSRRAGWCWCRKAGRCFPS